MIEPRHFNTIVEIFLTNVSSDGFGGQTQGVVSVGEVFARIEQGSRASQNNGQRLIEYDYILHIRNRVLNPKNTLIKYSGRFYTVSRVEPNQLQTQLKLWLTLQD